MIKEVDVDDGSQSLCVQREDDGGDDDDVYKMKVMRMTIEMCL